jgi:hypothetical protein
MRNVAVQSPAIAGLVRIETIVANIYTQPFVLQPNVHRLVLIVVFPVHRQKHA